MYSTSGTASSGRVLMKASTPLGMVVAGPVPRKYARIIAAAMRSNRISPWNRPGFFARVENSATARWSCKIGADRQILHDRNGHLAQMPRWADARKHEELWRIERAGGEDNFAIGVDARHLAVLDNLDAGRARAVQ